MKSITEDICIKGSSLKVGIQFPPVNNYTFKQLVEGNKIDIYYYILNTAKETKINSLIYIDDNTYCFVLNEEETDKLYEGVLMLKIIARIPDGDFGVDGIRTDIARCSTGILIIK